MQWKQVYPQKSVVNSIVDSIQKNGTSFPETSSSIIQHQILQLLRSLYDDSFFHSSGVDRYLSTVCLPHLIEE